ncbi:MAG: AbrB/MazE/SpoVT family DNA-binding domain-containing protein [Leptospira sp.]|nr:AbrB/MazE/SpoVT family DNA-binding domain-containing protein [Leptospira sp.]
MRVTIKGQVTIPVDLRQIHNITPNSDVDFINTNEGILIKKSKNTRDDLSTRLNEIRGIIEKKTTTKALMNLTRGGG